MEFQQLAFERRSIRGYRQEPVPRALLDEIIEVAAQTPSSMNTQPWHVHVVTGDVLDRIRTGNTERMWKLGNLTVKSVATFGTRVPRDRQKRVAAQLFEAAGIGWDDKEQRQDWAMRGFRQFDAPVSVIGCIDRDLIDSTEAYFDLGQFVYAMVIAAWDRGVGAVINGQGIYQSSVVREEASIPKTNSLSSLLRWAFRPTIFRPTMLSQNDEASKKLRPIAVSTASGSRIPLALFLSLIQNEDGLSEAQHVAAVG